MSSPVPWKQLILVPAILSLLVSLVRLTGELMQGSELFFNRAAGGPGALIGITWLVPIFGFYFGWSLVGRGFASVSPWRTVGVSLIGLVILVAIMGSVVTFSNRACRPHSGSSTWPRFWPFS